MLLFQTAPLAGPARIAVGVAEAGGIDRAGRGDVAVDGHGS